MPRDEETTYRDGVDERMRTFEATTLSYLGRIESQTTKTNGRVTLLEGEVVEQRVWRGRIVGGIAVLSFVVTTLIGVLTFVALVWKH